MHLTSAGLKMLGLRWPHEKKGGQGASGLFLGQLASKGQWAA